MLLPSHLSLSALESRTSVGLGNSSRLAQIQKRRMQSFHGCNALFCCVSCVRPLSRKNTKMCDEEEEEGMRMHACISARSYEPMGMKHRVRQGSEKSSPTICLDDTSCDNIRERTWDKRHSGDQETRLFCFNAVNTSACKLAFSLAFPSRQGTGFCRVSLCFSLPRERIVLTSHENWTSQALSIVVSCA